MRRISREEMVIGLGVATAVLVAAGVVAWLGSRRSLPAWRSRAVALLPSWGERDDDDTDESDYRHADGSDGDSAEADRLEQDAGESDEQHAQPKSSADGSSFTNGAGHEGEPASGSKTEPRRSS